MGLPQPRLTSFGNGTEWPRARRITVAPGHSVDDRAAARLIDDDRRAALTLDLVLDREPTKPRPSSVEVVFDGLSASNQAWRAPAATPPGFPCSRNTAPAGNGWS